MNITQTEKTASLSQSENGHVLRNNILLSKGHFSCELGLRNCLESLLLTRKSPVTGLMPQPMQYSIPSL